MFPRRKINTNRARDDYADGSTRLEQIFNKPERTETAQLAFALDAHFSAVGLMLQEIAESVDMLYDRLDNLERRLR